MSLYLTGIGHGVERIILLWHHILGLSSQSMLIHTCCDSSGVRLASTLVSERHQVNSVLLPWSQTSLHKGSDGAGQLCSHPAIIVLGTDRRDEMKSKNCLHILRKCQSQCGLNFFSRWRQEIWQIKHYKTIPTSKTYAVNHAVKFYAVDFLNFIFLLTDL